MSQDVINLMIFYAIITVIALVWTMSKWKSVRLLSSPLAIYIALMLWTLAGFVFVLDNSMSFGCIAGSGSNRVLNSQNIGYSSISLLLLSVGYFLPGKNAWIILFFELLYWLIKLLFIKGGYAVGLGGVPDLSVVFFDSVALTLRLLFIYTRQNYISFHQLFLIGISFILITVKITNI